MVWSQYKNQSRMEGTEPVRMPIEREKLPYGLELRYDDWKTWHSTDLYNMWTSLKCYVEDACIQGDILNNSDFDDVCEYVYVTSSKFKTKNAS